MKISSKPDGAKEETGAAGGQDILAAVRNAMAKSDTVLVEIFKTFGTALLDKEPDYIIYAICGATGGGDLPSGQQREIYNRINPAVIKILETLEIGTLPDDRQKTVLFIIRFMTALKLLFMLELLRNQQKKISRSFEEMLEDMEACGNA